MPVVPKNPRNGERGRIVLPRNPGSLPTPLATAAFIAEATAHGEHGGRPNHNKRANRLRTGHVDQDNSSSRIVKPREMTSKETPEAAEVVNSPRTKTLTPNPHRSHFQAGES